MSNVVVAVATKNVATKNVATKNVATNVSDERVMRVMS
jgi:hypothetical protein